MKFKFPAIKLLSYPPNTDRPTEYQPRTDMYEVEITIWNKISEIYPSTRNSWEKKKDFSGSSWNLFDKQKSQFCCCCYAKSLMLLSFIHLALFHVSVCGIVLAGANINIFTFLFISSSTLEALFSSYEANLD